MSFLEGSAVNDGINKPMYLRVKIEWDLPTVDVLVDLMVMKEIGSLLYKRDLKRYHQHIFVNLADIPKRGYKFDNHIFF